MKIKLLKSEEKSLDNFWEFINIFIPQNLDFLYDVREYRKDIIPIIYSRSILFL